MNALAIAPRAIVSRGTMDPRRVRWSVVVSGLFAVVMVAGLARQLARADFATLGQVLPTNPLFYVAFALLYAVPVAGDWIIFRRLWSIPAGGLVALVRKRIANDVVLSYSGEALFYAWAKEHARDADAPLGAVKDVAILSALAGNLTTLAAVAIALPFAVHVLGPHEIKGLALAVLAVVAMCLPFLFFSRRVFSLPKVERVWILEVQSLRVTIGSALLGLVWWLALPDTALATLLLLAAVRLVVSRLPVPNKDLLFAGLAMVLIGEDTPLAAVIMLTAGLTLVVHAAVFVGHGAWSLVRRHRSGPEGFQA